ncbi:MAG: hypothetical protein IT441_03560 [Phycisphaeraceae bacterium]|nr:hypothetical protein [Phycisphaeraceae bacterium]
MLKFFRKYLLNKWVLALGTCFLMVIFLLPSGYGGGRGGSDVVIGYAGGRKVYQSELQDAEGQLHVLGQISPLLALRAADGSMQWMLMKIEAKKLGLSASTTEAQQLISIDDLTKVSRRLGVHESVVIRALQDLVMVHRYKQLVQGRSYAPLSEALQDDMDIAQRYGINTLAAAGELLPWTRGETRVSTPLIERFLYDQAARARLTVVKVDARRQMDQSPEPTPEQLTGLFEQYKNDLPGQSKPYGIGFMFPRRVKIEYLVLPAERLRAAVEVNEAEALAYYQKNKQKFETATPAATQESAVGGVDPRYRQARGLAISELTNQKAQELADRILRRARGILLSEDARNLVQEGGYYVLPEGWQPMGLRALAQRLETEFSVQPDVMIRDHELLAIDELGQLPGIGEAAMVSGDQVASLPEYVASAKELEPEAGNPLVIERLQVNMPSKPLADRAGSRYLFRLIEARPQRVPATIDEVMDEVRTAARRLEAYRRLEGDERQAWLDRARATTLEKLATETGAKLVQTPQLTRSEPTPFAGMQPPAVEEVGRSSSFIDAVFNFAQELDVQGDLESLAAEQRITAVPVDAQMSLYLVRVDEFLPPLRSQIRQQMAERRVPSLVGNLIDKPRHDDPLAVESISKRINFLRPGQEKQEESPTQPQTTSQSI